jgi:hypothetical protein
VESVSAQSDRDRPNQSYRRAPDERTLDFYGDQPVGSMRGYVDVGAGRQGFWEFLT